MNAAALRRFWTVLWPLGWPIVALFGLAAAFWIYQGEAGWPTVLTLDPRRDPSVWRINMITEIGLPVGFAWTVLGVRHVRLTLSAAQLCIPGLGRVLDACLIVLAAATIAGMALLGVGLHGSLPTMLAVCVDAILFGLALPLFSNFLWIGVAGLQVLVFSMLFTRFDAGTGFEGPPFLAVAWSLAPLLALGWVLRLRTLRGLARVGASNNLLRNLLFLPTSTGLRQGRTAPFGMPLMSGARKALLSVVPSLLRRDLPAGRYPDHRSPDATIRLILGPRYDSPALLWAACLSLACAAFPWCFWLIEGRDSEGRVYDDWLARVQSGTFDWAFLAIMATGAAVMQRMNRLAELLRTAGGEFSELALLPAFGSERRLRSALVRQALMRPAAWLGLGLGLGIGGSVAGQLLMGDPIGGTPLMEFLLVLPILSVLLGGAVTGLGVLEGLFDRVGSWRIMALPGVITLLAWGSSQIDKFRPGRSSMTEVPPTWLWIAWALILVCLVAGLLGLTARWNRRRHILCR